MPHVNATLRAKRVDLASEIHDTEKKLTKLRADIANLDAAIKLLTCPTVSIQLP